MARPKPNVSWVGSTLGDRYLIERFIDQGGMSAVYEANDPNLQRTVAIKIIHPHLSRDPKFVQRFEQEAASVAKLRHPNIVQVYDFNHEEDTYYMVMEYIQGHTLKQVLRNFSAREQRLPLSEALRIMISICDAVDFAHQNGMVHRDLKPANVMLTPKGHVILMDFGVVKMLGKGDMTATGATIGTAKYMSPEQARGEQSDERSDIYALGVMLYEMVAGQPPFDSDTTVSILLKHVNEPVPDIRQCSEDIPADLADITEKALAKDPAERYQSAEHLATALRLLHQLSQVSPVSTDFQETVAPESSGRSRARPVVKPASRGSQQPPAPASVKHPVASSKSGSFAYWIIGFAVVGCLVIFAAAGLLTYLLGPLLNGAFADETVMTPDLPTSKDMVRIGAGVYSVGLEISDKDHAPEQEVEVSEYWIDQYEISNAQFAEFLANTDQAPPSSWPGGEIPAEQADLPVVGVTWDQAQAYCEWANKRLPTEAEWEIAARGTTGRLFPWGDNQQAVKLPRSGLYAVGSKPTNQSAFGVFDMAGNVWEWVDQPYDEIAADQRLLRGGANDFLKDMAYRLAGDPSVPTMFASAGMRCVADEVNVIAAESVAEGVYLEDTFINPGSGWPILSEGAFFYGYHPPDYYHVEVATAENFAAVSHPPGFDTVTVEADVLIDHTDTEDGDFRYGLLLRRMAENQFYAFTISPRNQTWQILKSTPAELEVLAQGEISNLRGLAPPGVTPDKTDKLQVDANGSDFVFQINGQAIAQVSDPDYATGEVGFFVETFDETLVHAHYDKLTVRRVENTPAEIPNSIQMEDEFTDPNSGWPTEDIEGKPYRFGYHPPDFYHVEPRAANEQLAVSSGLSYKNAGVETDVFVDHTTSVDGNFRYGLVLRRVAEGQFYAFTIAPRQNTWQVLKSSATGLETLAEGKVSTLWGLAPPGITPEKSDNLRVDVLDSTFVFQINGEAVVQLRDDDYPEGEIGFYVENMDETLAHIHYESLVVDEANLATLSDAPEPESAN